MNMSQCDHSSIDSFLSDDASEPRPDLLLHLESCDACRSYLDAQAAQPILWQEAKSLLQQSEFDIAGTAEFSAACQLEKSSEQIPSIQAVLDSLTPSEDPHRLGRLGTYEISGVIGAGGMGVVLKAVDPTLDRVVAIKVLAPHLAGNETSRRRFAREAKATAAVLHPNVIAIHSVSAPEEVPYLVMSYVRGGSLQKRLNDEGPLGTEQILRIGSQIAAGLEAAHERGLVHRDIKPENILLQQGVERVTITDFGLARAVDDCSVTREGTIAGTPQYMSPEQARGESVNHQSDLFSLGSVLYTLCTGRPPFQAETSYGVMRKISDDTPTSIRDFNPSTPAWLTALISKLMAKRKEDRYASAHETRAALESCLNHVQQPETAHLPAELIEDSKPSSVNHPSQTFFGSRSGVISMVTISAAAVLGLVMLQGDVLSSLGLVDQKPDTVAEGDRATVGQFAPSRDDDRSPTTKAVNRRDGDAKQKSDPASAPSGSDAGDDPSNPLTTTNPLNDDEQEREMILQDENGNLLLGPNVAELEGEEDPILRKPAKAPATWADLGLPHLSGYPVNEITLINALDQAVGAWKFTGTVKEGDQTKAIRGELKIIGGFKDQIALGSFPGWQIQVSMAGEKDQQTMTAVILAIPDPGRLTLMISHSLLDEKKAQQAIGQWDLSKRTVTWSERALAAKRERMRKEMAQRTGKKLPAKENTPSEPNARKDPMFEMTFDKDGSISLRRDITTPDGKLIQIAAKTTYRMKVDLEPYKPPKPDSTPLPNGYAIFVASRSEMMLQDETGDLIVGPNVAELGSEGDLIFGKIAPFRGNVKVGDKPGYFVLNSGKGDRALVKGLTEEQWLAELKKRGLKKAPELISSDLKRPRGDWSKQ